MEKTYNINGTSYTVNELIAIMREQLPGLKKYSHFADAEIEFCRQNKEGALFFYVSNDNGEDMMVKIGPEDSVFKIVIKICLKQYLFSLLLGYSDFLIL